MNVEAAYLHILGDVLNSIGVIIASSLIYWNPNLWYLDPICTLFFACIVFYTTRITFWQCVEMLMECTPDDVEVHVIEKKLYRIPGVEYVHDIHCWALSAGKHAFTVHLKVKQGVNQKEVLNKADKILRKKFKLNHLTIQIEEADEKHPYECGNDLHI